MPAISRLAGPTTLRTLASQTSTASQQQQRRSMALIASTLAKGSGKLFEGQASLPNLPVPSLEQTLNKYHRSTLPHAKTDAERKKTEDAVKSALDGSDAALFRELQKRLEHRAKNEGRDSWLSDWWNDAAYMAYRDPVVPYVSYFYAHSDDRTRRVNVTRSASQLKAMLVFRHLLETEQLAPEKSKTGYLCSASYPWMFNATRLPAQPSDTAEKYPADQHNHVVVVRNGRFWEFDVVKDGTELSAAEIESQLTKIINDPIADQPNPLPVGALTSVDRDHWYESRQALLQVAGSGGEQNAKTLERIQSSIILICLDTQTPVTREEVAWDLWFGDGQNRFYDKQQLISFPNGKSGFMGEHSCMDGTPTLRMNDFVLASLDAKKIDLGNSQRSDLPAPTPLTFALDEKVESRIGEARKLFDDLKAKHDLAILDFQGYGKGAIKKFKCSPDAWVQMAIQLAYFRMFNKPAPTYESAQTRKFKLGRTETIRSSSVESVAFSEAMEDANASDADRSAKFQAAVKAHLAYASAAADGQGVDRHLFGLKKLLKEGESLPALYRDEAFANTSTWQLSTSQISSERFDSWGFGEVTPTGFGCAYAIKEDSLTFTLTSLKLDAAKLRHYITEALLDLKQLHVRLAASAEKPKL